MPDKTVLITGCSAGGIGCSLAKEFQKRGLMVFASARSLSKMADLEKLSNVTLLALDVTSPTSIANALEQVKRHTGGTLDYLVNNSGQQYIMPALDVDIDEGKKMFDVNFWGVLRMIQAFSPLLIKAGGTVVNIGSIVAHLYAPFSSVYNASKAAVHMYDETLRLELSPLNVKVLTVVTGAIATNIQTNAPRPKLPLGTNYRNTEGYLDKLRMGKLDFTVTNPDVFAQKVVGDVLSGATGRVHRGANSSVTHWASHFMPTWLMDHILANGTDLDKVVASSDQ